jgi:predicted transcriptional regulator
MALLPKRSKPSSLSMTTVEQLQVSVGRITAVDYSCLSDRWRSFESFVLRSEAMYPGIKQWIRAKVGPELSTSHRSAFLLTYHGKTAAAAVFKRDRLSKICHIQVRDDLQDQSLGKFLFCLAALEFGAVASEVHFTLPENLWLEEAAFFEEFGFQQARVSVHQYRPKNRELSCGTTFRDFWNAVLKHIPTLVQTLGRPASNRPRLMMSVRPRFAHAIFEGHKSVEIRRSFSDRWINQRISLYASSPEQSLVGEATVGAIRSGSPDELWSLYGDQAGCTKDEFDKYTNGAATLYAIGLTDVHPYERPLPLRAIRAVVGEEFTPPQSYRAINDTHSLTGAVTLAQAVDSTFPTVQVGGTTKYAHRR